MKLKTLATAVLALHMAANTSAMELEALVTDAIQSNPELLQRVHNYRQMIQDEKIAGARRLPSLDLTASYGDYESQTPITNQINREYRSYETALTLTQNVYDGENSSNAVKQARARVQSEMMRIYDDADNLAIEISRLYFDALKQRALMELAEEIVASHEEILIKIEEQSRAGVGRRVSREQAVGRLAQARAGLIVQQGNLEDALTKLHYYAGRYIYADELVLPEIPQSIRVEPIDLLLDRAIDQHPAIKSARYNIQAAEYDYDRTQSGYLPKVDLKLQKRMGEDIEGYVGPTDEVSIALEFSYNLYNGGANKAERQKKLSAIYEHRDFSNKVRRQVLQSLRLSYVANRALEEQIVHLRDYVTVSESALTLYEQEFAIGERRLIELLDAESELNTAKVQLTEAEFDRYQAVYRIYEGMGQLFESMGLEVRLDDDRLYLAALDTAALDTLPFNPDTDEDRVITLKDHCDRSSIMESVNSFGCRTTMHPTIGYEYQPPQVSRSAVATTAVPAATVEERTEQLHFIYDSADLTAEAELSLARLVRDLAQYDSPEYRIEILAHSDSVASRQYNQRLSQQRAEMVRRKLLEAGIQAAVLEAKGMGEDYPITSNDTEEGRAQNRRVEFVVTRIDPQSSVERRTENLNFVYDSDQLSGNSLSQLQQLIDELAANRGTNVSIDIHAHSDNVASEDYNLRLSQRRADFVRDQFVESGFNEANIRTFGHGESQPIASNSTEEGRSQNRRVEFVIAQ